jgi:hypothetical protein
LALFDAAMRFRIKNSGYQELAEVSEYAGGRDLKRLVDLDLLEPRGEKRGRYYVGSQALFKLVQTAWEENRGLEQEDPFESVQQRLAI